MAKRKIKTPTGIMGYIHALNNSKFFRRCCNDNVKYWIKICNSKVK